MEIVIIALVLVVIVGFVGVGVARSRRRVDLEPPVGTGAPDGGVAAPPRPAEIVEDAAPPAAEPGLAEPPVVDEPVLDEPVVEVPVVDEPVVEVPVLEVPVVEVPEPVAVRPRLRDRLAKARNRFAGALGGLRGTRIDDEAWEELEYALLGADVGVQATGELLEAVRNEVHQRDLTEGEELLDVLKAEMLRRVEGLDTTLAMAPASPTIWLLVGVNGVGKTTTAGKLAHRESTQGRSVMLAAGDTFRAAAAEQLTMWAERTGSSVVRGADGSDPSSVVFDAVASASAKGHDLVIADTAGRLHTKSNLMDELAKVRRVADKGEGAVTESLLVLDATTGQNGLVQARQFTDAVELTGVVLTKLDGSAKGGIVFAIQSELGIPVKLVGLGETAEDLVEFNPEEFVEAMFE